MADIIITKVFIQQIFAECFYAHISMKFPDSTPEIHREFAKNSGNSLIILEVCCSLDPTGMAYLIPCQFSKNFLIDNLPKIF